VILSFGWIPCVFDQFQLYDDHNFISNTLNPFFSNILTDEIFEEAVSSFIISNVRAHHGKLCHEL